MAEIGAFTLESLVTGMYENSLVTFREYIQNSCDAIDDAVAAEILSEGDGLIEIAIDTDARRITIEDNGTGISVLDFKSRLSDIGYSDKTLETARGFRGIGRLCGLAYCRELRFISTARGEGMQSTAIFDAAKLNDIFHGKRKYTIKEALDAVLRFDTANADADEHFFRVELIDIVDTNSDLLNVDEVRKYLSFVAPVTYSPQFYYQTEIYAHAAALNFTITEYRISINGEQLIKPYKTKVKTFRGEDEIFGVDFRDFRDADDNLIAWSWIGLSKFRGVLDQTGGTPDNLMRGIRLRTGNIQIGNADVFKNLFDESRGTTYFIGEVHTVDKNLTPNGRRDYLEENSAYKTLEDALKKYFAELTEIYRTASDVRSCRKKINAPADAEQNYQRGRSPLKNRRELDNALNELNKAAKSARNNLDKLRQTAEQNPETPLSRVVLRMTANQPNPNTPPVNLYSRRLKHRRQNSRRQRGVKICAGFTVRLKPSYSATRNWRATSFSTRLKRSLLNEPPRPVNRAELEEQISAAKPHETCDILSERVRRRRAIFQGRFENFRRATFAGGIFFGEVDIQSLFAPPKNDAAKKFGAYEKFLSDFIRTGKNSFLDAVPNLREDDFFYEYTLRKLHRRFKAEDFPTFDIICVNSLFTFYFDETVRTINGAKKFLARGGKIFVGGVAATLLPKYFEEAVSGVLCN